MSGPHTCRLRGVAATSVTAVVVTEEIAKSCELLLQRPDATRPSVVGRRHGLRALATLSRSCAAEGGGCSVRGSHTSYARSTRALHARNAIAHL